MSSLRESVVTNILLVLLLATTSVSAIDILIYLDLVWRIVGLVAGFVVFSLLVWLNDRRVAHGRRIGRGSQDDDRQQVG